MPCLRRMRRSNILFILCVLSLSSLFLAPPANAESAYLNGTDGQAIYVYGNAVESIGTINQSIANVSYLEDLGNNEWLLKVPLIVNDTSAMLQITDADTSWLKLQSINSASIAYIKIQGMGEISNVKITSWNTANNAVAPGTDANRSYIYASGSGAKISITNSYFSNLGGGQYNYNSSILYDSAGEVTMLNNIINNSGGGVRIQKGSPAVTIEGNTISSAAGNAMSLVNISGSSKLFTNNVIFSSTGIGFYSENSVNILLSENNFYNNTLPGKYDYSFRKNSSATITDPGNGSGSYFLLNTDNTNNAVSLEVTDNRLYRITNTSSVTRYYPGAAHADIANGKTMNVTRHNGFIFPLSDYLDITLLNWSASGNYSKKWNESSPNPTLSSNHMIGDFPPNVSIVLLKNGAYWDIITSDLSGYASFTYSGGYSQAQQFEAFRDIKYPMVLLSLSKQSINPGQPVTITCSASDAYLASTALTVMRPNGNMVPATCGQAFSDTLLAGTYTAIYRATDTSGNAALASQAFLVVSVAVGANNTNTPAIPNITANSVNLTLKSNDALTKISVSLKTNRTNPSINATKMANITVPPPSGAIYGVYQYFNITKKNFDNSNIDNATIEFRVDKKWIASKNVTNIYLVRYENGWNLLRTENVSSVYSSTYNSYRAYTTAFSYFAIVGEIKQTSKSPALPATGQDTKQQPAAQKGTSTRASGSSSAEEEQGTSTLQYIAYILVALIVIAAAYFAAPFVIQKLSEYTGADKEEPPAEPQPEARQPPEPKQEPGAKAEPSKPDINPDIRSNLEPLLAEAKALKLQSPALPVPEGVLKLETGIEPHSNIKGAAPKQTGEKVVDDVVARVESLKKKMGEK